MKNISLLSSTVSMPLMALPVATPVVQLTGSTVMISPGSCLTSDQLNSLSQITDIVAPNLLHAGGVAKAVKIFPQARVWGVKGLSKRKPELPWTHELNEASWPYRDELPVYPIAGMPSLNESAFFHRESRTLIVSDLTFNLREQKGVGAWLMTHLFGTYHRFAVSRLFALMIKDRAAFQKSIEQILALDFDNILPSHGLPVVGNAKDALRMAFSERGFRL